MDSRVALVKCPDYSPTLVQQVIRRQINLLGGIEKFIKPGSRVLVKPNLLMAKQPEFGITTHPEITRAVVRLLKEIGCRVLLGDGPSVWGSQMENVDEVYEKTGLNNIARQEGVELVRFEKSRWRGKFSLTTWLDDCDYLVSIAKFKTHNLTTLTAAIKNLFGLLSRMQRTELHRRYFERGDFARILVDIYQEAGPALTVVDGITAMEGNGPGTSGKLRHTGFLLAGSDCLALDSILALIMGLKPYDILTNKEAAGRGLGAADMNHIQVLGDRLEDVIGKPMQLPATSTVDRIPRPVTNMLKKLVLFRPKVNHNNCIRCGACIEVCPKKVIKMKNNRIVIDYSGCIYCFCCQESCPNAAIEIQKSLVARLLRL
jgi:uncharacterized protein (DUF362 family)/NAD-dependent dihydropyrimidine dehydrogenase PreA subunit